MGELAGRQFVALTKTKKIQYTGDNKSLDVRGLYHQYQRRFFWGGRGGRGDVDLNSMPELFFKESALRPILS